MEYTDNNFQEEDEKIAKIEFMWRLNHLKKSYPDLPYCSLSFSEVENMSINELRSIGQILTEMVRKRLELDILNRAFFFIHAHNPKTLIDIATILLENYNFDEIDTDKKIGLLATMKTYSYLFFDLNLKPPISHEVYENFKQYLKPSEKIPYGANDEFVTEYIEKYFPKEWKCMKYLLDKNKFLSPIKTS